jgi:hypothetical protein
MRSRLQKFADVFTLSESVSKTFVVFLGFRSTELQKFVDVFATSVSVSKTFVVFVVCVAFYDYIIKNKGNHSGLPLHL